MKPSEVLIAAKDCIKTVDKWTQGTYARDGFNNEVEVDSPRATCFCAAGAVDFVVGSGAAPAWVALSYLYRAMGTPIASYNDSHTHEDVMKKFDEAIELAKSEDQ